MTSDRLCKRLIMALGLLLAASGGGWEVAGSAQEPGQGLSPGIITNSLGMKFAPIKAGEFLMGSPDTDKDSPDGSIYMWDGTAWRLTANLHMDLTDVSGTDATHVWVVAASGEVLFYNGTTWAVQYRAPTTLGGIAAIDAGHVWAIGFDTVYSTVAQGSASDWNSSGL